MAIVVVAGALVASLAAGEAVAAQAGRAPGDRPQVAICKDNSTSANSNFRATCKGNGGIKLWLARYVRCGDGTVYRLNRRASCRGHDGLAEMLPVDYVPKPRSGDIALCTDGTYTKAKVLRTACGTRGGVRRWLSAYGRCNDDWPIRMTRHASCTGHGGFRGLASQKVPAEFRGKVALCNDGNFSTNTDFAATCSGGEGIDTWLAKFGRCANGRIVLMSSRAECPDDEFDRLLDGDFVPKPTAADVALCRNGTYSDNTDFSATCSSNHGVDRWLAPYGQCRDGTAIAMVEDATCDDNGGFKRLVDPARSREDLKLAVGYWAMGGQLALSAIGDTLLSFANAAQSGDLVSARLECSNLQDEVAAARALDPVPYAPAEEHLQKALLYLDQAAARCIDGLDRGDPAAIEEAGRLFEQGGAESRAVTDALSSLTS